MIAQQHQLHLAQKQLYEYCVNFPKNPPSSLLITVLIEGVQNQDQKQIQQIIIKACDKFVGKYGVARMDITVDKFDAFANKATIKMQQPVKSQVVLKLWSALSFCIKSQIRFTIVDFKVIN